MTPMDALAARKSSYRPRRPKWRWRDYLTADERAELAAADAAKAKWLSLNKARASIVNRAIQRAKYAARSTP